MKKGILKKLAAIVAIGTLAVGIVGCGASKTGGTKDASKETSTSDGISFD